MDVTNLPKRQIRPAQWALATLILAFAAGSLLYRILLHQNLGHSAALFMGIPALLAIVLALTPGQKTVTGGILKGITIALLVIAPALGEGYVCILMAAPLFYIVGIVVGVTVDGLRNKRTTTLSCVSLLLLPMCLEGVVPSLTWDRTQSVTAAAIVDGTVDAVEYRLAQSPSVHTSLPAFLSIGFPRPLAAYGEGLSKGSVRTVHFAGAEGDPPGDLVMQVAESHKGYARFETLSDHSKLTQWIDWKSSEVMWKPVDDSHTEVTWTIHFERQLDPAWYFTPWERFAVQQAARFLISANATPGGQAE